MGCMYSSPDETANPRVFQVWNVDGDGHNVKPGKIEVTESELILYQRGDVAVRWALRYLRRYGFDAELFSFECGRRCPTGPGVYAFRCRRAEALFNLLQECIQNSGAGPGNISVAAIDEPISLSTNAASGVVITPNGTLSNAIPHESRQTPTVDSAGYLEPITVNNHTSPCPFSSTVNRSNSGTAASTPSGFVCIHSVGSEGATIEWSSTKMRQNSSTFSSCCSLGRRSSNRHYVNKDVIEQSSSNFPSGVCLMHQYVNAGVIASDSLRRCCTSSSCPHQNANTYVNSNVTSSLGLSPGHLPCASGCCTVNCVDINTNYAKLDDLLKQEHSVKRQKEQQHFYVNIKPEHTSPNCTRCISEGSSSTDLYAKDSTLSPASSTSVKGRNSHFYANLESPPSKQLAKSTSQLIYAILDLNKNGTGASSPTKSSSASGAAGNSLPASPVRTPEGYAQIDFDKTVALSNSAIPCPSNDESIRKTRHNAIIPSSSVPS